MEFRVLAIGDVVGENGLAFLVRRLRPLKREKQVDFTVVNGENAAGLGLFPAQAEEILDAGADVITLGNHTFDKHQIRPMLEENPYLLRPANYTARAPGRGTGYYDMGRCSVRVISLQGRVNLNYNCDNPFKAADRILKEEERAPFTLVISTPRPPVRSWPWAIIWTVAFPPCGAPTPMCRRRTSRFCPGAPDISLTRA